MTQDKKDSSSAKNHSGFKTATATLACLTSMILPNYESLAAAAIQTEPAKIQSTFVPFGYDSNDQVEVIVHGYLPNGCYRPGTTTSRVEHGALGQNGKVFIEATWMHHREVFCHQILTEYKEAVNVGYLEAKEYDVYVQGAFTSRTIKVSEAQSASQDDYTYLPVESLELESNGSEQELVLRGTFPYQKDQCLKVSEHKVYRSPEDVIVVLPIAAVSPCENGQLQQAFEYRVPLEGRMMVGQNTLVHVRSMNGRSVNKVFDKYLLLF